MEVGIIGLPLSGKTTIFNALTRSNAETSTYGSGRCEIRASVVNVPDPRVDVLSRLFKPRKTTFARIQFNDISGAARGQAEKAGGLDSQTLTALSQCDALLQVVRAFASDQVPHPDGKVDPARDLDTLRFELMVSDLSIVENRIERIHAGLRKGRPTEVPTLQQELALMQRLQKALENEMLISDLDLSAQEQVLIRGFQFLTAKPTLVAVNQSEEAEATPDLSWANHHKRSSALGLKGALEMEIAQLPAEEAAAFLQSYGIAEPSLNLLVRECYRLLGLMSFFTVGEDEVRAWTVHRGAHAVEAAGAIHSDLAHGFIRAEVVSYEDMVALGSIAEARRQGKWRLEGKDYVVQDGDVISIRFNV